MITTKHVPVRDNVCEGIFEDLFYNSTVGLAVLDEDLRFRRVNNMLASINGVPALDHHGRTVRDVIGVCIGLKVERALRQVLATGQAVVNVPLAGTLSFRPHEGKWLGNYFPLHNGGVKSPRIGAVVIQLDNNSEPRSVTSQVKGQVLRSWKEIGRYTGTCVKTVQRWECLHNFPVHRVRRSKGSVVFALMDEVDSWLRSQGPAS